MGPGFSPLDEELGLLPGALTPRLVESAVRLGTWLPFLPAVRMLWHFTRVPLGKASARRITERAGTAYVTVQSAEAQTIRTEAPDPPAGPPIQMVSVDGAMVPLVGGEWTEVKTLAIGTVETRTTRKGEEVVETADLSYFSRSADAKTFTELALVETHRRGTETAGTVCGVVDGAEWLQHFLDYHCPEAVRILDFAHASGYVAAAGQAAYGAGTEAATTWIEAQWHELRHGDPERVLAAVRDLLREIEGPEPDADRTGAAQIIADSLTYLEKRREQMRYAEWSAQGYPLGSGSVESANKLVVEARPKGAGMRWDRRNVDPMVGLRTVACSDRWEEAWPLISAQIRSERRAQQRERRAERVAAQAEARAATEPAAGAAVPPTVELPTSAEAPSPKPEPVPATPSASASQPRQPRRPGPDHPWRHSPIGRAAAAC